MRTQVCLLLVPISRDADRPVASTDRPRADRPRYRLYRLGATVTWRHHRWRGLRHPVLGSPLLRRRLRSPPSHGATTGGAGCAIRYWGPRCSAAGSAAARAAPSGTGVPAAPPQAPQPRGLRHPVLGSPLLRRRLRSRAGCAIRYWGPRSSAAGSAAHPHMAPPQVARAAPSGTGVPAAPPQAPQWRGLRHPVLGSPLLRRRLRSRAGCAIRYWGTRCSAAGSAAARAAPSGTGLVLLR
ncbi:MAG: hypothetical protein JJLCMIEE_00995 [Acidimicrobiales bacterium]|nr:hypothetical protein [Acidimicrobiales bacterium]